MIESSKGLSMATVSFRLNGSSITADFEEGIHLLELLREECGITSVKDGCAPQGVCGCCTILLDGRPALSCLLRPEQVEGREVVTLEGIPEAQRRVLARAFVQEGAHARGIVEAVKLDVMNEMVSIEHAKKYYGVVFKEDTWPYTVDEEATDKLRVEMKKKGVK